MKINLTENEKILLLSSKVKLPQNLHIIILNFKPDIDADISEDDASDIREYCTDALDSIGFDKNDEPTVDGLLLESLIDKFFC